MQGVGNVFVGHSCVITKRLLCEIFIVGKNEVLRCVAIILCDISEEGGNLYKIERSPALALVSMKNIF